MLIPRTPKSAPPEHILDKYHGADVLHAEAQESGQGNEEDELVEVEDELVEVEVEVEPEVTEVVDDSVEEGRKDIKVKVEVESEKDESEDDDMRSEEESSSEESESEEKEVLDVVEGLGPREGIGFATRESTRVILLDVASPNMLKLYCRNCNDVKMNDQRICPSCGGK